MPNRDSAAHLLDSIKTFHALPDEAFVRQPVVEVLYGVSAATVWRMVKAGKIPAPRKLSARVTAWRVGQLRSALKAAA